MGSSSKSVTVGYRYYFDIHFAVGLPIDEIIRIEASDKVAWQGSITENGQIQINAPNLFGGDKGEGGIQGPLDVRFGDQSQTMPAKLISMLGGIVPAFRGITTCFFSGLVASLNPYPKAWTLWVRGGNRLWDEQGAWYAAKQFIWLEDEEGDIKAMNPVHILYLAYTSRRLRKNPLPRSRMDGASWTAAADTLYAEGFGLCIKWTRSDTFASFREAILSHISAEIYIDRSSGLVKIRLLRDDYTASDLPLFDEDSGLLEVLSDESGTNDGNSVPSDIVIQYTNANTGDTEQVRAVNAAVAQRDSGRSVEITEYPGIPTGALAARIAQRDLRIKTSGLKRYKITCDRRARSIEPGQPFRFRSLNRGIEQIVVRAARIEDGTLTDGRITLTVVQDVFGLPATSFIQPPTTGWAKPDRTPEAVTTRKLVEATWRELVQRIDPANLALIDPSAAYLGALAVAPTPMSLSATLMTRVGSSGDFTEADTDDWCPSALTTTAISIGATAITLGLANAYRLEDVALGGMALIDNELLRVDALNITALTVTLARGCVDTVPAAHALGSRIWFMEQAAIADEVAYSSGVTLHAKLLTNTSEGQLSQTLAPTDSLALQGRQGRPYPPGNFQISAQRYPAEVYGDLLLSWSHRDRLLQSDQIIDTLMGNIGPEAGTTYSARLLRADTSAVLATQTGLTGTSATLTTSYSGLVIAELWAVRDGLSSYQRHQHTFTLYSTEPMATESGESITTESGETLLIE